MRQGLFLMRRFSICLFFHLVWFSACFLAGPEWDDLRSGAPLANRTEDNKYFQAGLAASHSSPRGLGTASPGWVITDCVTKDHPALREAPAAGRRRQGEGFLFSPFLFAFFLSVPLCAVVVAPCPPESNFYCILVA